MSKILLKIIAQDHVVSETEVDSVTLETVEGQITILPNHIPLVSQLKVGEAMVINNGKSESMAIAGGFVEVGNNRILILADRAERAEEIDILRAEEAHKRAEEKLAEFKNRDDVEYVNLAAQLEKELARVKIARKHSHTHSHGSDQSMIK